MPGEERRKVERSGAFLSDGFQTVPVPIRTLSDEYHETPEPQDSDVSPPEEPEGLLARLLRALGGRRRHDQG